MFDIIRKTPTLLLIFIACDTSNHLLLDENHKITLKQKPNFFNIRVIGPCLGLGDATTQSTCVGRDSGLVDRVDGVEMVMWNAKEAEF